jgi:antitoxin (DNA-binding transcriptional repressor) of toxin-antitoxin stability system
MREISIESLVGDVQSFLSSTQGEKVLITQQGKPIVVLVGVENKDQEDLDLESSPEFWRMIEERRSETLLAWADVKDGLLRGDSA